MKPYQRILICIDQPERDLRMLAYAREITSKPAGPQQLASGPASAAESKEIHILHVAHEEAHTADEALHAPTSDQASLAGAVKITPESLRASAQLAFPPVSRPATSNQQAGPPPASWPARAREAAEQLQEQSPELICAVVDGAPLLEILRYAYEKEVDLIVIGRHYGEAASGDRPAAPIVDEAIIARRVTRKATCSVLVLPEDHQVKAQTIVVPARDSECSANALDTACGIASATGGQVILLNVFQVSGGYTRVGMTLQQHQSALQAAASRECASLLKRVDTSNVTVESKLAPDLQGKPVPIIHEAIASLSADLVVIGARGRTGAAGVLLGAVTEQLIRESPVPVLAVKKKGECLGILQALLTLASEG